jgi:hypothetical protein
VIIKVCDFLRSQIDFKIQIQQQHLTEFKKIHMLYRITPIILATWEAGRGRLKVQGQPQQILLVPPSPKQPEQV